MHYVANLFGLDSFIIFCLQGD